MDSGGYILCSSRLIILLDNYIFFHLPVWREEATRRT